MENNAFLTGDLRSKSQGKNEGAFFPSTGVFVVNDVPESLKRHKKILEASLKAFGIVMILLVIGSVIYVRLSSRNHQNEVKGIMQKVDGIKEQLEAALRKKAEESVKAAEIQNFGPSNSEIIELERQLMLIMHSEVEPVYLYEKTYVFDGSGEGQQAGTGGANQETILIMGGVVNNDSPSDDMIILDTKSFQWKMLSLKLPDMHTYGGSVYLNGEIYIFGGIGLWNKFYKLDISQMKWIRLPDIQRQRIDIDSSSFVFQGCIWIVGRVLGYESNTLDRYCPETNEWTLMPNMTVARESAAAAACNGKIIVSGGDNWRSRGEGRYTELKSVESFDPIRGIWTPLVDLPAPWSDHSMLSNGSSLYVVGGHTNEIWRINPDEKYATWKELAPMKKYRYWHSAVVANGEIYVIGGFCGTDCDSKGKSTEIFDGKSWRDGPAFAIDRFAFSSVTIPTRVADILLKHVN